MTDLRYLDVPNILLATGDLLRVGPDEEGRPSRRSLVEETSAGEIYLPLLIEKYAAAQSLPKAVIGPPLSEQLAETDRNFDGFGGAIFFFCEMVLRHPGFTPEQKSKIKSIKKTFTPALAEFRKSLATEASSTAERRKELADYEEDLRSFTVPTGDEPARPEVEAPEPPTLLDWVNEYLDHGDTIGRLLSERASLTAEATAEAQAKASMLRLDIIGLVGRFRQSLTDELLSNPDLPRNLVALVFGFFDQTAETMKAAASRSAGNATDKDVIDDATPPESPSEPTEPPPA